MSGTARVMVREGLFTDGDPPALCWAAAAPPVAPTISRADTCPYCSTEDPEPIELSRRDVVGVDRGHGAAPGVPGEVPYGVGVVELPEGIRVITAPDRERPGRVGRGTAMELRIVPLHATPTATTS
jgi:uncharacterized OB-fold protein